MRLRWLGEIKFSGDPAELLACNEIVIDQSTVDTTIDSGDLD